MLLSFLTVSAKAHFVWLAPPVSTSQTSDQSSAEPIQIVFSEAPVPGDADLLERIAAIKVWKVNAQQQVTPLNVNRTAEAMTVGATSEAAEQADALYVASLQYGVMQREGEPYRLVYVAKTGPAASSEIWNKPLLLTWYLWISS